jgi:polyhydroxyalkanoate synthesis repressor PhaR
MENYEIRTLPGDLDGADEETRTIKRYGNRKLYDTQASRYVTLDEIATMIREGHRVAVLDNQTQQDLTAVTLAQIILEQEKVRNRTPLNLLRELVRDRGDTVSDFFRARVAEPVARFRSTTEVKVEELLGKSEATKDEVSHVVRDWIESQQHKFEQFQRRFEEKSHELAEAETLKTELAEIQKQAIHLETRIAALWKKARAIAQREETGGSTPAATATEAEPGTLTVAGPAISPDVALEALAHDPTDPAARPN